MQRDRNLFRSAALAADASSRRSFIARGTAALAAVALPSAVWAAVDYSRFKRVPTQYIAALAAPGATSGDNAETWGLWRQDPGPRGLRLTAFDRLANGGAAPAGWHLDKNAWWLEEHGLLMESPEFPMPAGQYVVTGDREITSVLTVHSASGGKQRWELADGATLHDVTHLRCRSALYTPAKPGASCTPAAARQQDFPVAPGAAMPPVADCAKQDYQVLIVIGVAKEA
jgi:hypothetical protein